jgi:hypothetical protein
MREAAAGDSFIAEPLAVGGADAGAVRAGFGLFICV